MAWIARKTDEPERHAPRVDPLPSAPVEVQIMGHGSLDILRARNVSTTGLGIYVDHGFAGFDLAAEVELVITLPRVRPFLARGVIKHVTTSGENENHFGLVFVDLKESQRQSIQSYVTSRAD